MKGQPAAIRVIEAAEQDISAISDFFWEMWREAGPDAPGFTGATEGVIAEISAAEAIRPRIGGPERRMHIAYEHDRVVGDPRPVLVRGQHGLRSGDLYPLCQPPVGGAGALRHLGQSSGPRLANIQLDPAATPDRGGRVSP